MLESPSDGNPANLQEGTKFYVKRTRPLVKASLLGNLFKIMAAH